MKRLLKILGLLIILTIVGAAGLYFSAYRAMGVQAEGPRMAKMQASTQWREGRFKNVLSRVDGPMGQMLNEWFFGGSEYRNPVEALPVGKLNRASFAVPPESGLRATWLGHSSVLIEIDGQRVLIDPVWGPRASPFTFMGPKRWFEPPLPLDELPELDAILISHDHYDHLDYPTVVALAARKVRWFVPLGIGADLIYWGVPEDQITELDWWQAADVGKMKLTCTPSRHFSGRGLSDADQTLWSGWAITNDTHRVYYSGDTAMFGGFKEIGERLGPFDLTMIEIGAYNALWSDVHLGPEQAVQAHQMVKGRVLLPVHWGLFDLALHGWTEPMERVLVAAKAAGVKVVTPGPGTPVEPLTAGPAQRWWPQVPWVDAETAPCLSTGVEDLRRH